IPSHIFFYLPSVTLHILPSFPTRRSSDLLWCARRIAAAILMNLHANSRCLPGKERTSAVALCSLRRSSMLETSDRSRILLGFGRSEEHTSELQSQSNLVCRLLLEKKIK